MAVLGPRRPDDETSRHAQEAINQARQALGDPEFQARMQPNDRALFEERLRNAERSLADYRRTGSGGMPAMAVATTTTADPVSAVVGVALLAMGFAITSAATNRQPSAQSLSNELALLIALHQVIARRPPPPSPPAAATAVAGAGAALMAVSAVIGSIQGLTDVNNQVERDIRANSERALKCQAFVDAFRAAVALLRRGLMNPTATPQRTIAQRAQELIKAIIALYGCMGLPVPSFGPRR